MKNLLVIITLLLLAGTSSTKADALLLPPGTAIEIPGKEVSVLDAPYFLLTRPDMEKAVLAMETIAIREKQIEELTASYKTLEDGVFWNTVKWSALAGAVVFVGVEVFHLVKGK